MQNDEKWLKGWKCLGWGRTSAVATGVLCKIYPVGTIVEMDSRFGPLLVFTDFAEAAEFRRGLCTVVPCEYVQTAPVPYGPWLSIALACLKPVPLIESIFRNAGACGGTWPRATDFASKVKCLE